MNIRLATNEDIALLNSLMQTSSAYQGRYAAILQGYGISKEELRANVVHLAERDGDIIGFYSLITGPDPELDLLFVSDDEQGSGVGKALFEHMCSIARDLHLMSVKIISHPPALNFYLRMGAYQIATKAPAGRVTWSRPILQLDL